VNSTGSTKNSQKFSARSKKFSNLEERDESLNAVYDRKDDLHDKSEEEGDLPGPLCLVPLAGAEQLRYCFHGVRFG
jgi:hypothetical protein